MDLQLTLKISTLMPRGFKKLNIDSARELPKPTGSEFRKYVVKKGDTPQSIAEKFGLDPFEFADFLREKEGKDTLYEGQEIEVPLLSNSKQKEVN